MNPAQQTLELARRDFVQRAKSKAFLVATALTVGIVLMVGPLVALANRDPGPTPIGVVGNLPPGAQASIHAEAALLGIEVDLRSYPDLAAAERAVITGDLVAAIDHGNEIIFGNEVQPRLAAAVTGGIAAAERKALGEDMGLSSEEVTELLRPVTFTQRTLEPTETDDDRARRAGALVGLMLLYISILMFGQFVMMGVMEEKQTRVVEVVLSRVKPTQVLTGKVLGVGLLGLVQIVALGAAALITLSVVEITSIDLRAIGLRVVGQLLLWYLLGYAFYSFLYGALGATISRQEDMQGTAMLPVLLILPGFFLGQVALADPNGWMAHAASLVPVWSPMVMAVRATTSTVPWWEVAVSILLIVLATYGLIRYGGRIYRGAILHTGSKTKLRTAWRSASQ